MDTEKLYGDSADVLIYRFTRRGLEVLTGIRQHEPYAGCITIPFGGHVKPSDENIMTAAIREAQEETGLITCIDFFLGCYGPRRRHYSFTSDMEAVVIGDDRSSVNHVFAGRVMGGSLKASTEQKRLRFLRPNVLVRTSMCFDHALVLANFLYAMRKGDAYTWRNEALRLVK